MSSSSDQKPISPKHELIPPEECETTSSASLGGLSAAFGDGDGFRTPTGSGDRIPEARECPPAPRKPAIAARRRRPAKRRAEEVTWTNGDRRIEALLDLTGEVESLFPPVVRADFTCKIKKARTV